MSPTPRDVGDVDRPDFIGFGELAISQKIRIFRILRRCIARALLEVDGFDSKELHNLSCSPTV